MALCAGSKNTGGFTEFVPLSLNHQEAPMYQKKLVPGVREGATGAEVIKMHAVARLMLGATFRNIQASWVKEGPKMAQYLLSCGANDLGGTLINESISTSAGSLYGQLVPPRELRRLVRDAGRTPAERSSLYAIRHLFDPTSAENDPASPLDDVGDAEARFGSYKLAWPPIFASSTLSVPPRRSWRWPGGQEQPSFCAPRRVIARAVTAIGNTGDDLEMWGLSISPTSTRSCTHWPASSTR
jgi:hypothetical protein